MVLRHSDKCNILWNCSGQNGNLVCEVVIVSHISNKLQYVQLPLFIYLLNFMLTYFLT